MNRHTVILWLLLLWPAITVFPWLSRADETGARLELGPLLGHAGPNRTRIWIKASAPATSAVIIGESSHLHDGRWVVGPGLTAETDYMGVIEVTGLRPATRYFYKVVIDSTAAAEAPYAFVSAPPDDAPGRLRVAVTSCVASIEGAGRSWQALAKVPIDLLLQLGDNVYAGTTDPERQRPIYYAHRKIPAYRRIGRATPTLAVWDDWDYAHNNSDGTAPGKERALRTFKQFWPNPGYGQAADPGVYFKASWGDVDFFMLDGRYHRSPNPVPDDGRKTMLGPAQLAWLKRQLAASRATFKFIASGGQWESRGREDSWRSFMRERDELFRFIRERRIEGVVLLSGDRHATAGYQIQGRFLEVTSSPFAGENHGPPYNPDEMFMLHDEGNFFVVLDVDTTGPEPRLILEVHRVGKGMVRRRALSWGEINGRVPIATCALLRECRN